MQIIPAILTNSPTELEEKLKLCEGVVERVQIDVIDGTFANNLTVGFEELNSIKTELKLDAHLMVDDPIRWSAKFENADRIIGQIEKMSSQPSFITQTKVLGKKVGLALDLDTPVTAVEADWLKELDVVLVMSVKAGFGGQEFHPEALDKVKQLVETRKTDNLSFKICLDGGINEDDIKMARDAGVDEFVVGHSLFEGDVKENMDKLMEAIK